MKSQVYILFDGTVANSICCTTLMFCVKPRTVDVH